MIAVQHMVDTMLSTERILARHGWGRLPATIMLIQTPSGVTVQEIPVGLHCGEDVYRAGVLAAQSPAKAKVIADTYPHLIGLAFGCESWTVQSPDASLTEDNVHEHPDALVAREITAVDIWGRGYSASRIRGTQPTAKLAHFAGGRVNYGLVEIVMAVAQYLPRADLRALRRLHEEMDPTIDADGAFHTGADAR